MARGGASVQQKQINLCRPLSALRVSMPVQSDSNLKIFLIVAHAEDHCSSAHAKNALGMGMGGNTQTHTQVQT